ncbi:MAG: TCP-1/cpn60 chaperonin family protein [Bacillota bacterium]|uniref:Chaperonin GroEL (HSP60 family) n=2 Tax=Carboxydocella TaxID=178898 RepID=A0A1T4RV78_9FIRM|nr:MULTISPECIES: TCP-1/cpn60 chaperonin family protein [Carboxydocella]AVX20003.1 Chaperonin GroEL (HSP60 family) [Carboxydocella thermautotrophica]AVX30419.1 Chaperonin GroEL (HSP60 family) [Carboxydocella thermautotrophica]SKA19648.1 Chaperonin GroEL (HSP60 family) [Carboxydocella sporoproducens DSM 16521]
MSLKQQAVQATEVDEKLAALMTNANAIRAIAAAVEGTLGPKGLDTMLVDKFGDVVITNDGVTILTLMEANHPAARLLINVAKAQQAEIGDGTTTATVMAGALVAEGVNQVVRGVPVTRVIEGIRIGVRGALEFIEQQARPVRSLKDPLLYRIAYIAGRENEDIARLVVDAARLVGIKKLKEPGFKLADTIVAEEGADNQVFSGVIINKEPMNDEMPRDLRDAKVLIIDDALEPEELEDEALATEAGFNRYMELQQEFKDNVRKIVDLGVGLVIVDRGVEAWAEETLTDAGVMVLQRVSNKELRKAAEHTGARPIKRTGLKRSPEELVRYLGQAKWVLADERLEHVRILGGAGKPMATVLVGAATEEVVGERERIAKDAASSVQAAVCGGVVAGGGSLELAAARQVEKLRENTRGMAAYGIDCVVAALKRPLAQIVENAGFNSLEKLGDVVAAQAEKGNNALAIDCDSGQVVDMWELGVVDPALVKLHALRAAGEVAEAILRIDTIIRKKEEKSSKLEPEMEE